MQFQIFGSPELPASLFEFSFTPEPNFGSKHPKFQGEICYGRDLRQEEELDQLNLSWIIEAYENYEDQASFFNDFFVKLAGTTSLRQSIEQGLSDQEIREQWTEGLDRFKSMRSKYLIYE